MGVTRRTRGRPEKRHPLSDSDREVRQLEPRWGGVSETCAKEVLTSLSKRANDRRFRRPDAPWSTGFVAALREIRDQLNCSHAMIATTAGLSASQLSGWLDSESRREVSPDAVCSLSWALAYLLDYVPSGEHRRFAREHLDSLTNSMLYLAGYSSEVRHENVVWRSKIESQVSSAARSTSRSSLRIGWFGWHPFLFPDTADATQPRGWGRQVTEQVCSFFYGGEIEFAPVPFLELEDALLSEKIDLISPIMFRFARRLRWLSFSERIPDIHIGFDGVLAVRRIREVLTPAGLALRDKGKKAQVEHLDLSRLEAIVGSGEVAEAIIRIAFPNMQYTSAKPPESAGHAADLVEPEILGDGDKVKMLFTNRPTCDWALERFPGQLMLLSEIIDCEKLDNMKLGLAFGLPAFEPKLLKTINESIKALDELGYFSLQATESSIKADYRVQQKS